MRPNTSAESSGRAGSHKTGEPAVISRVTGPTTFLLASESELDRRTSAVSPANDISPVRTLKETLDEAAGVKSPSGRTSRRDGSRRRSTIRPRSIEELRNETLTSHLLQSQSTAATTRTSSQEPSLPSSPKSLSSRSYPKSDEELTQDDSSSQAVASDDDDDDDDNDELSKDAEQALNDSAPQLIMPSIRMPSRRPFSGRGKQIGKFKILVAGARDSGKTSLIKSIVQLCEDIVHVDPLTSSTTSPPRLNIGNTANAFQETYASTKPYPSWWSDLEESRVLKRRKSMGDQVLERNICFVDTQHSRSPSFAITYVEQQLIKTIDCANQASSELTKLLSGAGGSQVDVVLYLVSHTSLASDIEQINTLSRIANVIPLISKSDLLSPDQISEVKRSFSPDLSTIPRLPISFGPQHVEATNVAPFSSSCVNGPDYDNMEASLLMASEYVQPLVPSELSTVVEQLFEPDVVCWLRHLAAKKLISWYNSGARMSDSQRTSSPVSTRMRSPAPSTLSSPLQASLSASAVLVPVTSHSELSFNTSNSFALAKVADHTQKEERLAHIRLSRWASDLQLSLQRERERYEHMARSERALWLVESIGREIQDGQLVPATSATDREAQVPMRMRKKLFGDDVISQQVHDPLGLLRWQETVRAQTWLALQIVGSFGVVGGLALFVTKAWGYETSFHQWAREWGIWYD